MSRSLIVALAGLGFVAQARPSLADPAGVAMPATTLPFSAFASPEAKAAFVAERERIAREPPPPLTDMAAVRRYWGAYNDAKLAEMRRAYRTAHRRETIGGVAVDVVTPADGVPAANRARVLINLHGGAFMWGAGSGALVEAIPIAAVGGFKVVTVDYRLAPEHRYPAASEDVEAVYRALLKDYAAENIGIYGCSAGGALTAQATAWIVDKGLPRPGAIGTFCGTGLPFGGDSAILGQLAVGAAPMDASAAGVALPYLSGVPLTDARAFPGNAPAMLAKFPPTLLLAGTRDFAVSALSTMDRRLRAAEVPTQLVLFDGLGHAFFMSPKLPEAREAFATIARFFDRHLGRAERRDTLPSGRR